MYFSWLHKEVQNRYQDDTVELCLFNDAEHCELASKSFANVNILLVCCKINKLSACYIHIPLHESSAAFESCSVCMRGCADQGYDKQIKQMRVIKTAGFTNGMTNSGNYGGKCTQL